MEYYLGDKTFWMGDKISSVDCTAYGSLSAVLEVKFESDLKDALLKHEKLVNYYKRMEDLVWGKKE